MHKPNPGGCGARGGTDIRTDTAGTKDQALGAELGRARTLTGIVTPTGPGLSTYMVHIARGLSARR